MVDLEQLMEFPCDYTIKVVGRAGDELVALVHTVVSRHAPENVGDPQVRPSRHGRFVSVNLTFRLANPQQLYAIHTELNRSSRVRIIL